MKCFRIILCVVLGFVIAGALCAADFFGGAWAAYGDWQLDGNRLVQLDDKTGLAMFNIPAPDQKEYPVIVYEFNARLINESAKTLRGGFGIHTFIDEAHKTGKSWGNGRSYLLWVNFDKEAFNITPGLSAQVYRSKNHSEMDLVADVDLNKYARLITDKNLTLTAPIKIKINRESGKVNVYDPTNPNYSWYFYLPKGDLDGSYVALRTNKLKMSFGR
jgi:hypothetical protein